VTKYEELILSVRDAVQHNVFLCNITCFCATQRVSVQHNVFLCQYKSISTCFKAQSIILQHIRKVRRKFLVPARTRDTIPRSPRHSLVTRQPALCRQHTNTNLNIGKQKWSPWSGPRQPVRPTGHERATFWTLRAAVLNENLLTFSVLVSRAATNTRNDGSSQIFDPVWGWPRVHSSWLQTCGTPPSSGHAVPRGHILQQYHHVASLGPASGRGASPTSLASPCIYHSYSTPRSLVAFYISKLSPQNDVPAVETVRLRNKCLYEISKVEVFAVHQHR